MDKYDALLDQRFYKDRISWLLSQRLQTFFFSVLAFMAIVVVGHSTLAIIHKKGHIYHESIYNQVSDQIVQFVTYEFLDKEINSDFFINYKNSDVYRRYDQIMSLITDIMPSLKRMEVLSYKQEGRNLVSSVFWSNDESSIGQEVRQASGLNYLTLFTVNDKNNSFLNKKFNMYNLKNHQYDFDELDFFFVWENSAYKALSSKIIVLILLFCFSFSSLFLYFFISYIENTISNEIDGDIEVMVGLNDEITFIENKIHKMIGA